MQAANPHLGSHMIAALHNVSQTEAQTEWERMTGRLEETETKTIALLKNPGTKGAEAAPGRPRLCKSTRLFKYLRCAHTLRDEISISKHLKI